MTWSARTDIVIQNDPDDWIHTYIVYTLTLVWLQLEKICKNKLCSSVNILLNKQLIYKSI